MVTSLVINTAHMFANLHYLKLILKEKFCFSEPQVPTKEQVDALSSDLRARAVVPGYMLFSSVNFLLFLYDNFTDICNLSKCNH